MLEEDSCAKAIREAERTIKANNPAANRANIFVPMHDPPHSYFSHAK
jgi:hypothetical protein